MANCIIHVGMHKTGSTSIQDSLVRLNNEQFFYALLGHYPNHSLPIYSLFSTQPKTHFLHRNSSLIQVQNYINHVRGNLVSSITKTQDRTMILSGEEISFLSKEELIKFYEFLKKSFEKITIVAYVRSPYGYITSAFQQKVKDTLDSFNLDKEYRNYQKTFSKFDEVFGRENVCLWMFNPRTFYHGCVVTDFCHRLGIFIKEKNIIRSNESLSKQAVSLIYTYRKFGKRYGSDSLVGPSCLVLGQWIANEGNDKFRISSCIIKPILEKHHQDIEWIETRLEGSFEEPTEYQFGDICSESDLLTYEPKLISKLVLFLGERVPNGVTGKTAEEVALLVHLLREQLLPNQEEIIVKSISKALSNRGRIIRAELKTVIGWAVGNNPNKPVTVELFVNGKKIAETIANKLRPALKERGIHVTGMCGFDFYLEDGEILKANDEVDVKVIDGNFIIETFPYIISEFKGRLDVVREKFAVGWAFLRSSEEPVLVSLYVNNELVMTTIANRFRKDLFKKKLHHNGNCGFLFELDKKAYFREGDSIRIKIEGQSQDLNNSPLTFQSEG